MRLSGCHNIADLRAAAKRRLPRGLFEFVDRATEDDIAMARNRSTFENLRLAPKVLVDVSDRNTGTSLFGKAHSMPMAISPAGPAGYFWYKGELALARAAAQANVPFTLSTYSTTPMQEIVETGATLWFQLYLWSDRALSYALLDQVMATDFDALVVTVDTAVLGNREYAAKNGFSAPFKASPRALYDMLMHPRWLAGVPGRYLLTSGWPGLANLPDPHAFKGREAEYASRTTLSTSSTWEDIARLRERWPKTLMIKGILRPEDAEKAVSLGVDVIVVSNHGGRNLDSAVSPIEVLPAIVSTVGSKATVLMDSGIRRGSDIVKALALGAKAVFIGRAALYGIAAAGEAGALHAIELLRSELHRTMALIGARRVEDIHADLIATPGCRHCNDGG